MARTGYFPDHSDIQHPINDLDILMFTDGDENRLEFPRVVSWVTMDVLEARNLIDDLQEAIQAIEVAAGGGAESNGGE
jgi:hypothetical protein